MNAFAWRDSSLSIGQSFTVAAWVVILGVVGSWFMLKQGPGQVLSDLPEIPRFTLTTVSDVTETTWIQRAEQAYAAGRITRPEGDSALFYYQKMLDRDAENLSALAGIERITSYLINAAESALLKEDWSAAADWAAQTLAIDANNLAARSVVTRVERFERIKWLGDRAVDQIAAGNLTKPVGNNALASYQEMLSMDPASIVAQQGIESVAQRLATVAQTEAFADNHARARELIALAKSIAPDAPGIAQTEKLTLQWTDMVKDQAVKEDLLAAAKAMQEGHLLGIHSPTGIGALDHYQSVLKKDPNSTAAQSGVGLVIDGLLDQAWALAREERLAEAATLVSQAEQAGATNSELRGIKSELDFLQRRATARAGNFDTVLAIRELVVRRQAAPILPRNSQGGWVELLFTVDEDGGVKDIEVVETSSSELLEPALSAVKKWRFEPYLDDGRPIPVRSGVRFSFQT